MVRLSYKGTDPCRVLFLPAGPPVRLKQEIAMSVDQDPNPDPDRTEGSAKRLGGKVKASAIA